MTETHFIITNRASVSGDWIHIVPRGELPNRAAGITQVLDDAALDAILANIAADKQRLGEKWPGIYAGREHFIYNDEQDSAALAWFKDFEKRADGIWAKADGLTPIGKTVIANAEYKFTSFVADRRDTQDLGGGKVRILKLDTIGFTNQANGKELLTPITNRKNFPGSRESADSTEKHQQKANRMKSVCTLLGLSAEADEASVHAAVTKLVNRGDITVADLAALREEHTTFKNRSGELETENKTLLDEQIAADLATHKITEEKIINRVKPVLAAMKNRADRLSFIQECVKPAAGTTTTTTTQRLLSREAGQTPGSTPGADAQPEFVKIVNRIVTEKKCSKAEAISDAITNHNTEYSEWLKAGAGRI